MSMRLDFTGMRRIQSACSKALGGRHLQSDEFTGNPLFRASEPRPQGIKRFFARRRASWALVTLALFSALPVWADTTNFTFDTNYVALGVDQWGSSATGLPDSSEYSNFFGTQWNTSTDFGGFTKGLFGENYGFAGSAYTDGKIGLDVYFKGTSGSVNLAMANTVNLAVSNLSLASGATGNILVTQSRPAPTSGNVLTSVFPTMQFSVDATFKIDAGLTGTFAYGVGSTTGTVNLADLTAVAGIASANPALATVNPFDTQLRLLSYNLNDSHNVTVGAQVGTLFGTAGPSNLNVAKLSSAAGLNIPLTKGAFIPETSVGNYDVSANTDVEFGSITLHDPNQLNLSSGSSYTASGTQARIISLGVDPVGLATLLMGYPLNPLDPKVTIPGTPVGIEATLLKAQLNLDMGASQTITLTPNTHVRLVSNYDVTYNVNGQTITTKDLDYVLPNDGSSMNIQITGKPTQSDWQLTPSIYVSPTLENSINLDFSTSLQVTAGAFAFNYEDVVPIPVLSPLFSQNIPFGDLGAVSLLDRTFGLSNVADLQQVYHSLRPLVGGAVPVNFSVAYGDNVIDDQISGTFTAQPIAGTLSLTNSVFNNTTLLEIPGTFNLNGPSNLVGASGLVVTGTLKIDKGSQFIDPGEVDANGNLLLDSSLLHVPGFVDGNGVISGGTYNIAGRLSYSGADIDTIGTNANFTLTGNNTETTPRIDNDGHDALQHLHEIDGSLTVQDLAFTTDRILINHGTLAILGTSTVTSAGYDSNSTAILAIGGGSTLDTSGGPFANLSATGELANFSVGIGDLTGGRFIYSGVDITTNSGQIILSGTRPSDAYILRNLGSSTLSDGLMNLSQNAGSLILANSATQTIQGDLNNSGTLGVTMPQSPATPVAPFSTLTVNGALTNSGTIIIDGGRLAATTFTQTSMGQLQLTRGAEVNLTGSIGLGSGNALTGGQWLIDGTVSYNGSPFASISADTDVRISGAGQGFVLTDGTNAYRNFGTNNGIFALLAGATATTSVAFTNNGQLTVGANSAFTSNGLAANTANISILGTYDTTGGNYASWTGSQSLPLSSGLLVGGGTTNIEGVLTYSGPSISGVAPLTGVAAGTTLAINHAATGSDASSSYLVSPGYVFNEALVYVDPTSGTQQNGFASFADVRGTLSLGGGSATRTDASLTIYNGGSLILGAGSTLQVTGSTFELDSGGSLDLEGNLILGGATNTTTFAVPENFAFGSNVQLGRVVLQPAAGSIPSYYVTTGKGALTSSGDWFNSGTIVGVGSISGQSITNTENGVILAAGGDVASGDALAITGTTLTNTGIIGSAGNSQFSSKLTISNMTVVNSVTNTDGSTSNGQIFAGSYVDISNSTVNGGIALVTSSGRLSLLNTTFTNVTLAADGAIDILNNNGGSSTLGGTITLNPSAILTVKGGISSGATLNVATGSTFNNFGTIVLEENANFTGATITNKGYINITGGRTGDLANIDNTGSGRISLDNGTNLQFTGTFNNAGRIELSGEAATDLPSNVTVSHSTITLLGDTTFTGGGTLQLGGYNTITSTTATNGTMIQNVSTQWRNGSLDLGNVTITGSGGQTLTISAQNITGQGNIGDGKLGIVNEAGGSIRVLGDGSTLAIQTNNAGFTNRGLLDVGEGSTMTISGGVFHSFTPASGGHNATLDEGSYRFAGTLQIDGITSFDNNATIVYGGPNAKMTDASGNPVYVINNLAGGSMEVRNDATYSFPTSAAQTFSNAGLLIAGPNGTLAITGGHFTNFASNTLTGGKYSVAGVFKFDGANIVTNSADITMRGTGQIQDELGNNALAGFSTNYGRFAVDDNGTYTVGVGTFHQGGKIAVYAGSTFDYGTATVDNVAANLPEYWVAGTLKSTNPVLTDGTHVTLYGTNAQLLIGADTIPMNVGSGAQLTMAGGHTVLYDGGVTFTNNGLWEIGSPTAENTAGNMIRSAAQVTFGNASQGAVIDNTGGTVRYYGGATDDNTTGKLTILNLNVTGSGTFDLNGDINMGASADLDIHGVLANTLSASKFVPVSNLAADRPTVNVYGGLVLHNAFDTSAVNFNFTYTSGSSVYLNGIRFSVDSGSFGTDNTGEITLIDGADIVDRNGHSIFGTITQNEGTITLTNTQSYLNRGNDGSGLIRPLSQITLAGPLTNTAPGKIAVDEYSSLSVTGALTNYGSITSTRSLVAPVDDPVYYIAADSLTNYGTFSSSLFANSVVNKSGATMDGTFATGSLLNESNATFTGAGDIYAGNFINHGTVTSAAFVLHPAQGTSNYGEVQNYGDLTLRARSFTRDDSTYAPIANFGTLHIAGFISNPIAGYGDIRTDSDASLLGDNSNFYGNVYIDNGELRIASDNQLGGANPSNGTYGGVSIGAAGTLGLAGTLNAQRPFTVADGATIDGYDVNSPGVITGSVTSPGTLNVAGKLTINAVFGSSLNLVSSADLTLPNGAVLSGTLSGNGTLRVTGNNSLVLHDATMTGGIVMTGPSGVVAISGNNFNTSIDSVGQSINFNQTGTLIYGGILSGTAAININSGNVVFNHQQSNTGTTTIAAGTTLTLDDTNTIAAGNGIFATYVGNVAGNIVNNGTFIIAGQYDRTLGASSGYGTDGVLHSFTWGITGNGAIIQNGTGTTTALSSAFLNNLTINAGIFELGDGVTTTIGSESVVNNGTLRFNHVGDGSLVLTGSGNFENYGPGSLSLMMRGGSTLDHFGSGTLSLASGNTYTGKTRLGSFVAPVHNVNFGRTVGGGTLNIVDESSLGIAPATYVPDQLQINGGTFNNAGANPITLASTRGVTIGSLGANFGAGQGLTIPTLLNTSFTNVPLKLVSGNTLSLLLPANTSNPFTYEIVQGTLVLSNQGGTSSANTVKASENGFLEITGGGTTTMTASSTDFLGRLQVDTGNTLQLNGSTAGSPGASSLNYLTVNGTLQGLTPGVTFKSVVGSGNFIRSGGGTATVTTLNLGGTVTIPFATLNAPSYQASGTVMGTQGAATLTTTDGFTTTLDLENSATFNIGNSFTVSGAATGAAVTLTKTGDGDLLFTGGGTVSYGMIATAGYVGGSNNTTFSGGIAGAGGFILLGNGLTDKVTLTGNNTYTGQTLAAVGEIVVGNGGTAGTVAGDILVNQFGGIAFNRSDNVSLTNNIQGEGYLKQSGTGTLTILTSAEYSGATYINSGILQIGNGGTIGSLQRNVAADPVNNITPINVGAIHNNATLVFNRSDALDLDNDIDGTGAVSQIGAGTTTLHGALTYSGLTSVNFGKLVITGSATNAGGISVASGATLSLQSPGDVGGSIANNGVIDLDNTSDYTLSFNTTGTGQIIKQNTGLVLLGATTHTNSIEIDSGKLGYATAGTLTSNLLFTGVGTFYKGGSGILQYTADNYGFAGDVLINGGTLQFGAGGASGMVEVPIALADPTTAVAFNHSANLSYDNVISGQGGLHISGPGILTLSQANTFTGITTIDSGSVLVIGGTAGNIGSVNVANDGTLRLQPALNYNLVLNSNSSGAGLIDVEGAGTVTLNGAYTNTGGATIASGSSLALGFNSTFSGPVSNSGNLTILTDASATRLMPVAFTGIGSLTVAGGGRLLITGNLTYNGPTYLQDGSTLALSIASGSTTLTKTLSGTGNFEKSGAGKLTIGASSTVTGNIIVSGGVLEFGGSGSLESLGGNYQLDPSGTLGFNFTSPTSTVVSTPLTGSGTLHQYGMPATLAGNSSTFTGNTLIDAGTTLSITGSLGYSSITANGTLRFDLAGDQSSANNISGAGVVSKLDTGKLTLTGTLGLTGGINVAGALVTQTGTGSTVGTITAASFVNNTGGDLTVGSINAPTITNNFSGLLTVTGNNTSASQTILNGGTLVIGNGGTSGSFASDIANNNNFSVGTVAFNRSDVVTVGHATSITGGGTLEQRGTGTLQVYSDQFHTVSADHFVVTNGTMEFMQPFGSADILNNATLKLHGDELGNNSSVVNYANRITSNGALITYGIVSLTNNANSYAGAVDIEAGNSTPGSLTLASLANPLTGADVTIGSLAGTGTLNFGPGAIANLATLHITGNSTHSGAIHLDGANLNVAGDLASSVTFADGGQFTYENSTPATFSGTVTGVSTLTHNGTARLTLNSSISGVTINQGELALGPTGSVSQVILANQANAVFNLNGHTSTLSHLSGGGANGGNIELGANDLTVNQVINQVSNPATGGFTLVPEDTVYAGSISGTGNLIKQGGASLELAGANTFTGNVDVQSGTVILSGTSTAAGYDVRAAGILYASSAANLGTGDIRLHDNGRFESLDAIPLNQSVTLTNGGTLAGDMAVNSTITGTGTLNIDGGRVLLNGQAYANPVNVVSGTLAIGNLNAVDPTKTTFNAGSTFDINSLAWTTAISLDGANLANGGANPVTITAPIGVSTNVGLIGNGSRLTFTGTFTGSGPIELRSSGDVVLNTASAGRIQTLTINGGNLNAPRQSLTAVTAATITGNGRLELTGAAQDIAFTSLRIGDVNNGGGSIVNDTNGSLTLTATVNLAAFPVAGDIALFGGSQNMTLAGALVGATDLGKIGTGTLTISDSIDLSAWNGTFHTPAIDVQEGTLAANSSFYNLRHLTVGPTGIATLTDSGDLVLRSLTGSGNVNLGNNNLEFRQLNTGMAGDGVFTGSVTTTGNVTHNDPSGNTFGTTNGDKQFYGSLTANSLTVNVGDVTVSDALNVNSITVKDKLTTTTNGISTNAGTILNGNFASIQGTVKLLGGENITGNANNVALQGAAAQLLDGNGNAVRFSSNSAFGNLSAQYGAALNLSSNFTNQGYVTVSGYDPGTFSPSYIDGAGTINQAAGQFFYDGSTLTAARLNVSGGGMTLGASSTFQRSGSGTVLTNPGIVLSGGLLEVSGFAFGGIQINGGVFAPGGNYVIGTARVGGGVIFNSGGQLAWDIADATGGTAVGADYLDASYGSASSARIYVNATTLNPFVIAANSTSGGTPANFDDTLSYTWTVAHTGSGVMNFSSDKFRVDASAFGADPRGNFGLVTSGNDLQLVYQPSFYYNNATDLTEPANLPANGQFGGLRKDGLGILTLSGNNAYTGATKINAGTVVAASNNALGTGQVIVAYGATLSVPQGVSVTNRVTLTGGTYQHVVSGSLSGAVDSDSSLGGINTIARILAGNSPTTTTVFGSFSKAPSAGGGEGEGEGGGAPPVDNGFRSDVFSLSGTGAGNAFVLNLEVATPASTDGLQLDWLNPTTNTWLNAIYGDINPNTALSIQQGYTGDFASFQLTYGTNLGSYLGAWGTYTENGETGVWAVIDHNSSFALVPEPSSAFLILAGVVFFLPRNRKARRHPDR